MMMMGSCSLLVLNGLILMQIYTNSECYKIDVSPDRDTIVTVKRKTGQAPDCSVCTGADSSKICNSEVRVSHPDSTSVSFNCSQPGDVFTVEINQEIDCATSCSNINAVHPHSTRFLDFNRIFTWDVKVQPSKTVQLDFPAPGMKQIKPSDLCPNKHTYTIISYQRAGPANIGTFCCNGTISRIQVLYKGRVSLEVPKGTNLNPSDFKVSVGPDTKMLVEVDAKLPRGESLEDFFTPNYASGFVRENTIKWNFAVEPLHNFSVKYLSKTEPECQKGVSVEYLLEDKTELKNTLNDDPPANKQGNFSMTLASCDAKKGLSLNFEVSVFRGGTPNLCTVDLQNDKGLSLQIEKKNPMSYCEMKMNSLVQEKIVVPAESKAELSFLDCSVEDLQLTATKTIVVECSSGSACAMTSLTIPTLNACLPAPLHQFTWLLRVPDQGSINLTSFKGILHQSVPEKECDTLTFLISGNDGFTIGQFCSIGEGTIQNVQIKGNASITAIHKGAKDLSQEKESFLKATFSPEITENVIYSVSPPVTGSTYLTTPNWPDGMMPSSSVTWAVVVPPDYRAELMFTNITTPMCASGQSAIKIQPLDSQKIQTWTVDQAVPSMVTQYQSFYLNMSNCEPKIKQFAVLSKITLQRETRKFLGIILAVVGILLLLLIIALIVICVIKKKKKPKANRSSIYIPKGTPVLPGNVTFPKTRADNESHVYASIDDPMMYGHLLDKDRSAVDGDTGAWSNGHQVDTYRSYTGPADSMPTVTESPEYTLDRGDGRAGDSFQPFLNPANTFIPAKPRMPLISQSSLGFEDRRMVQNELNTFKNAGDINPIRLSSDESRLQPQQDSDSDSLAEPEYEEAM